MSNHHENLTAEQIRQQMNYVRQELNDDVEQVVEDANSLGDVRAYVKAQPIGWLIAATVAGFAVVPSKKESSVSAPMSTVTGSGAVEPQQAKNGSMIGAALGMAATMGTRLVLNKLATAGMGFLEQSQQGRVPPASQTDSASHNHEPYSS